MHDAHSMTVHEAADLVTRVSSPSLLSDVAFTIGTLVTDPAQYAAMRTTFLEAGFGDSDCEYLTIDNTGPSQTCAYRGLNAVLDRARGRYVVLCHQDVRLIAGIDRDVLEARLAELDERDPAWALAGNAGATSPGTLALRISDPHGKDRYVGHLPSRVMSLDENFIVAKRAARIGFSHDLTGFHFYGADICLAADVMGYSAYVIDFHLAHLSGGRKDASFAEAEAAFRAKWSRALRPRWMQTTCALVHLAGHRLGRLTGRLAEPSLRALTRRRPNAAGWTTQPELGPVSQLRQSADWPPTTATTR
jgi:hypothetical protein